jgi:hypothetical protein
MIAFAWTIVMSPVEVEEQQRRLIDAKEHGFDLARLSPLIWRGSAAILRRLRFCLGGERSKEA